MDLVLIAHNPGMTILADAFGTVKVVFTEDYTAAKQLLWLLRQAGVRYRRHLHA